MSEHAYCLTYADKLGVRYTVYGDNSDALEAMASELQAAQPLAWCRVVQLADAKLVYLWKAPLLELVTDEWVVKMAKLEGNADISAGGLQHENDTL